MKRVCLSGGDKNVNVDSRRFRDAAGKKSDQARSKRAIALGAPATWLVPRVYRGANRGGRPQDYWPVGTWGCISQRLFFTEALYLIPDACGRVRLVPAGEPASLC